MANLISKFASFSQEWTTPDSLYGQLNKEFNFVFDLAASAENTKCPDYFTLKQNALIQTWKGVCWLNLPYGGSGKLCLRIL